MRNKELQNAFGLIKHVWKTKKTSYGSRSLREVVTLTLRSTLLSNKSSILIQEKTQRHKGMTRFWIEFCMFIVLLVENSW